MYDLLIQNARIVDGTGAPWFYGDVAVENGKIGEVTDEVFIKASLNCLI